MESASRWHTGLATVLLYAATACAAAAQTAPPASPAADASPSPSPSPPGLYVRFRGSDVFIDQGTSGPGTQPPEATSFESGMPLSPMSPYDWFSSAVATPGVAGEFQYFLTGERRTKATSLSATVALGAYAGDVNNLMYWGEPLVGQIDPHQGRSAIDYRVAFPTQASQNDVVAGVTAIPYSVSFRANDGSYQIGGGYIDLAQSDRFVFAPPAVTNANPSTGVQTAETLGPGMPNLDAWTGAPTTLPLLGADVQLHRGSATMELTDALLPALQGTSARAEIGSVVLERGDAGRFSAEIAQIRTSGDPIGTTTFFGTQQMLYPGPQGRLYTSVLAEQHQTIGGIRAFFHAGANNDLLVELGRASMHSALAAEPATSSPGNYVHLEETHHFSKDADAGIAYYRFDPRYATVILPYGVPENIWSVAWSWPGQWLKSTYQSVDNSIIGINRAGYRLRADYARGRLELHAAADVWRQIEPITLANASQEGWVDGYFLPQTNGNPTLGWQRQANLYAAWHSGRDDLAMDSVWDRSYRPAGSDPIDGVSINYPEIVVSLQHHFTKSAIGVAGYGRYSANGMWSTTPVGSTFGVGFLGGEWDVRNGQQLLVQVRRYTLHGLPSIPNGPPGAMQGSAIVVDHRFSLR